MLHVDIISACCLCGASALAAAGMLLLSDPGDPASARALRVLVAGLAVLAAGMFWVGFAVDGGAPRHLLGLLASQSVLCGMALLGWGFALLGGVRPPRALALPLALILLLDALAWTRSFHVAHVPTAVQPWLGVFVGTFPVIVAALAFNLVNKRLAGRLRTLAHTDELTGILSRRALRERAPELLARQEAGGGQVAALMVAIDHFRDVDDRHGHPAGDAVLQRTAHLVAMNLRSDSIVARYGGEEFAVLLPVTGLGEARAAAERLRKAIESDVVDFDGAHIGVTVSVGLALLAHGEPLEAALTRADKALHRATNAGRNRVDIALAAA